MSYFWLWIFKDSKFILGRGSKCLCSGKMTLRKVEDIHSFLEFQTDLLSMTCCGCFENYTVRSISQPNVYNQHRHPKPQSARTIPIFSYNKVTNPCNLTSFIWNSSLASDKSTFLVMQQDILHLFYISQSSHPCFNLMKFNESLYNSCKTWMETRFRFHDAGRRNVPYRNFWGKMEKFVLWIASNNSENGEE